MLGFLFFKHTVGGLKLRDTHPLFLALVVGPAASVKARHLIVQFAGKLQRQDRSGVFRNRVWEGQSASFLCLGDGNRGRLAGRGAERGQRRIRSGKHGLELQVFDTHLSSDLADSVEIVAEWISR